jgi:DNA-binding transcriptional LysR family regulator
VNRESAEALMQRLLQLSRAMDDVCAEIEQLESDEERMQLRRGMSGMLADVYTELMRPLIQQFPDLDPDAQAEGH